MALGHDVRLMPASYVKPCVKRGKNDANDCGRSICAATDKVRFSVNQDETLRRSCTPAAAQFFRRL